MHVLIRESFSVQQRAGHLSGWTAAATGAGARQLGGPPCGGEGHAGRPGGDARPPWCGPETQDPWGLRLCPRWFHLPRRLCLEGGWSVMMEPGGSEGVRSWPRTTHVQLHSETWGGGKRGSVPPFSALSCRQAFG